MSGAQITHEFLSQIVGCDIVVDRSRGFAECKSELTRGRLRDLKSNALNLVDVIVRLPVLDLVLLNVRTVRFVGFLPLDRDRIDRIGTFNER